MGTHCTISHEREDGTIAASYCHYDGYMTGAGAQLANSYSDAEKIKELVALGDMSYLTAKINPSLATHSFETPEDGVTVFYHRDRGESWSANSPTVYDSFDAWFEANQEQYNYLYIDGVWQCRAGDTYHVDINMNQEVS